MRTDDYLQSANLIVSIAGVATADALVPGAGSAMGGMLSVRELGKRLIGRTPDLNQRVALELQTALAQNHLSNASRTLIPQMILKGRLSGAEIMAAKRNPDLICMAMLGKLTDPAHEPQLLRDDFRLVVAPLFRTVLDETESSEELRPAFETAVAETMAYIAQEVDVLTGQLTQTAEDLGKIKGLVFGIASRIATDVDDMGAAIRELNRAVDIALATELRSELPANTGDQVAAVLDRVADLNAQDKLDEAAAEFDRALDEMDDEQGRLDAKRAKILDLALEQDILRRNSESAAKRILARTQLDHPEQSAAFNVCLGVQVEWGKRGLRQGIPFDLDVAIALARLLIEFSATELQRTAAQNNLAIALQSQGTRTGGQDGADLLAEAVTAYRAALCVYTEDQHPVDWAMTQNNLGNALTEQGKRTSGKDGAELLEEAVTAYRAALCVYTEDQHPVDWAMTQNNLSNALQEQGTRTGVQDGAELLE